MLCNQHVFTRKPILHR